MKRNFDKRHSVKTPKPLSPGDTVWIPERETGETVENESNLTLTLTLGLTMSRQRTEHFVGIAEILSSC